MVETWIHPVVMSGKHDKFARLARRNPLVCLAARQIWFKRAIHVQAKYYTVPSGVVPYKLRASRWSLGSACLCPHSPPKTGSLPLVGSHRTRRA